MKFSFFFLIDYVILSRDGTRILKWKGAIIIVAACIVISVLWFVTKLTPTAIDKIINSCKNNNKYNKVQCFFQHFNAIIIN